MDYNNLRQETGFNWFVGSYQGTLRQLTGIPIREFNLSPDACIEAYRKGRPLIKEMFGEDVQLPGLATPAISYGHVNGLGSQLTFPEGGEVAHAHIYASLKQGIKALQKKVDFATAGMAPFYLNFRKKMQVAFPDEPVGFAYNLEGPITTAWELRGEGFFTDIFDNRAAASAFLKLSTKSILDFHCFRCSVQNIPVINSEGSGMCDDIASMIPPSMWPELVLPYWEQYYSGMTTGKRSAHVEDLRPAQLKFLEEIGLSYYDPSISPQLSPKIIFTECRVPFSWRLGSFHYSNLSLPDVTDFVFQAVADGASSVSTYIEEIMCQEPTIQKIFAFIKAAKEAKQMLGEGISRQEIGERATVSGKRNFWTTPLWGRGKSEGEFPKG